MLPGSHSRAAARPRPGRRGSENPDGAADPGHPEELASAWQWLLHPVTSGRGTRLVARQRYSYPRRESVLWHLVAAISVVMERRMLHSIKARAEGRHPAPPAQPAPGTAAR
jgi:hypothetical protein